MKTLILILLLPMMAIAGTEDLYPSQDAVIGSGWAKCDSAYYYMCLGDGVDEQFDYMYDNNDIGSLMWFNIDNSAVTDSVIDSITIYMKWRTDNTGNLPMIIDSVADAEVPDVYRQTEQYTAATADVFQTDSITYTTTPADEAYTWDDVNNILIGIIATDMVNNKQMDITEFWVTVFYHSTAIDWYADTTGTAPDSCLVTTYRSKNVDSTDGEYNPTNPVTYQPEFSAIVGENNTEYYKVMVGTAANDSSLWNSGRIKVGWDSTFMDGERCDPIRLSLPTDAAYDTDATGFLQCRMPPYYWMIRFWDSSGKGTPWSTSNTFQGVVPQNWDDGSPELSGFDRRWIIYAGTTHAAIPYYYVSKLNVQTGYAKKIATDGAWNVANPYTIYWKGYTYFGYIALTSYDGNFEIIIGKFDDSGDSLVAVDTVLTTTTDRDAHNAPYLVIGADEKLHVIIANHNQQNTYMRTEYAHQDGSGIDIKTWDSAVDDEPAALRNATYPRFRRDTNGNLYVFFRQKTGDFYGSWCYMYSTDNGDNWSNYKTIVYYSDDIDDSGTAESGTDSTLTDTDKSWTTDYWTRGEGNFVIITAGAAAGDTAYIDSNSANTIWIRGETFSEAIDNTSEYEIKTGVPTMYCSGAVIDDQNRAHLAPVFRNSYENLNRDRAISYIYSDQDGSGEYFAWMEMGGDTVGFAVDSASVGDSCVQLSDLTDGIGIVQNWGSIEGPFYHSNVETMNIDPETQYPVIPFYVHDNDGAYGQSEAATPIYVAYWDNDSTAWQIHNTHGDTLANGDSLPMLWTFLNGGQNVFQDSVHIIMYGFTLPVGQEYFGGELFKYVGLINDPYTAWDGEYISRNSGKGIGGLEATSDIVTAIKKQSLPQMLCRPDGNDIILVRAQVGATGLCNFWEMHRVPDRWGSDNTAIYFQYPNDIAANVEFDTNWVYLLYTHNDSTAITPDTDPDNIWFYFESFEGYDDATQLVGQGSWTLDSGAATSCSVFTTYHVEEAIMGIHKVWGGQTIARLGNGGSGAAIVEQDLGSAYTGYEVSVSLYNNIWGSSYYGYLNLIDSSDQEFGFGLKFNGDGVGYTRYNYDGGAWTPVPSGDSFTVNGSTWYRLTMRVTSSGVSCYINRNDNPDDRIEVVTDDDHIDHFNKIRLGGLGAMYFDMLTVGATMPDDSLPTISVYPYYDSQGLISDPGEVLIRTTAQIIFCAGNDLYLYNETEQFYPGQVIRIAGF